MEDIIKSLMELDKKLVLERNEINQKIEEREDDTHRSRLEIEQNYKKKLEIIIKEDEREKKQEHEKIQTDIELQYKNRLDNLTKIYIDNKESWINDIAQRCKTL